jgi:nitroreductase
MDRDPSQVRPAPTELEIHPLIRHRWSPRALSDAPVEPEKLKLLLEAARWAPSSYNEQPWRFLVATRDDPEWLQRLQSYLSEGNAWAKQAPILIASAFATRFSRNEAPNPSAKRDLGAAEQNMFLQAFAVGLFMHQMAGFDRERLARDLLPEGFEPGAMTAIGYPGDPGELSERLREREAAERNRRPLSKFVFGVEWGKPAAFLR